jgi:hypothetical protein
MTNEEYLRTLSAKASQKHGEDAFFVQQLASLEHFKKVKPALGTETFHIGARQARTSSQGNTRRTCTGT